MMNIIFLPVMFTGGDSLIALSLGTRTFTSAKKHKSLTGGADILSALNPVTERSRGGMTFCPHITRSGGHLAAFGLKKAGRLKNENLGIKHKI